MLGSKEVAEKVVSEEAVIHHVDQASRRRSDLRFYGCWAFCQNPSCIPQVVFLTLTDRFGDLNLDAQLHFSRPRTVKRGCVYKILVHIDSVEDLMFYHHSPKQLRSEGRVQLREFHFVTGRLDDELEQEDEDVIQRHCRPVQDYIRRPREDDDEDRGQERNRLRGRDLLGSMSHWFDNRRRNSSAGRTRERDNRWYMDYSPRRRTNAAHSYSPPPHRASPPVHERRTLRQLWIAKEAREEPASPRRLRSPGIASDLNERVPSSAEALSQDRPSEAIAIVPLGDFDQGVLLVACRPNQRCLILILVL
jgi:hypothetical protein